MDRLSKPTSSRAQSFKKKSTTIDQRSLRAHRKSQEWKQLRQDQVNSNRNMIMGPMSPLREETTFDDACSKKKDSDDKNSRRDALMKWKAERELKRKLEAQEKAKKKPFKVSITVDPKVKPLPKVNAAPTNPVTAPPKRVTRASACVQPTKPLKSETKGPVTRSRVAPAKKPSTKPEPPSKSQTRSTRGSTSSRTAAPVSKPRPPSTSSVGRATRSTATKDAPARLASRGRVTRTSSQTKVVQEESTDDEKQPPSKSRAVSTRRSTPGRKKGRTNTPASSDSASDLPVTTDDDKAPLENTPIRNPMKAEHSSSEENSLLARDNASSSDEIKPTTSTPFVRRTRSSTAESSDEDRTFSGVNNKYISSKRGEVSFAPNDFTFKPPSNISLMRFKPISPNSSAMFLHPGQSQASQTFTPPVQRSFRTATSSSKKTPRSQKNFRNSLILRTMSPEEGVEILKQSPMIEIKRRTPKHSASSQSPIDPLPNLDDLDLDMLPPSKIDFGEVTEAETSQKMSLTEDNHAAQEEPTSSPVKLDSIEEEMETDQADLPTPTGDQAPEPFVSDALPTTSGDRLNMEPERSPGGATEPAVSEENGPDSLRCPGVLFGTVSEEAPVSSVASDKTEPSSPMEISAEIQSTEISSSTAVASPAGVPHDIKYFRNLLLSETDALNLLSAKWEEIQKNTPEMSEEIEGQVRTTIGQAQLLIAQRFKQFSGLVDDCEFNTGEMTTHCSDLQGFWDMIFFQVEDVYNKFSDLDKLKANNWVSDIPKPKKKILKKKVTASMPGKPAGVKSKFAAFRAKMKQKEEPELPGTPVKVEEQPTEKTFDAGFFKINSPVASPKFHCEAGSPYKLKDEQRTSCSPFLQTAINNSYTQSCGASPSLKPHKKETTPDTSKIVSVLPPAEADVESSSNSAESCSEAPVCLEVPRARRMSTPEARCLTPLNGDSRSLRRSARRSLRTPASVLRIRGTPAALSPLVKAELAERLSEANTVPDEESSVSQPVMPRDQQQFSLFTPEETTASRTPQRARRQTRQSLRLLTYPEAAIVAGENVDMEAEENTDDKGEETMNFTKYLLPQNGQTGIGALPVTEEKENTHTSSPRRRSRSACLNTSSPMANSRLRVNSTPDGRTKRVSGVLFTPFQRMATPVRPQKEHEDETSPTLNLMSFSPVPK